MDTKPTTVEATISDFDKTLWNCAKTAAEYAIVAMQNGKTPEHILAALATVYNQKGKL